MRLNVLLILIISSFRIYALDVHEEPLVLKKGEELQHVFKGSPVMGRGKVFAVVNGEKGLRFDGLNGKLLDSQGITAFHSIQESPDGEDWGFQLLQNGKHYIVHSKLGKIEFKNKPYQNSGFWYSSGAGGIVITLDGRQFGPYEDLIEQSGVLVYLKDGDYHLVDLNQEDSLPINLGQLSFRPEFINAKGNQTYSLTDRNTIVVYQYGEKYGEYPGSTSEVFFDKSGQIFAVRVSSFYTAASVHFADNTTFSNLYTATRIIPGRRPIDLESTGVEGLWASFPSNDRIDFYIHKELVAKSQTIGVDVLYIGKKFIGLYEYNYTSKKYTVLYGPTGLLKTWDYIQGHGDHVLLQDGKNWFVFDSVNLYGPYEELAKVQTIGNEIWFEAKEFGSKSAVYKNGELKTVLNANERFENVTENSHEIITIRKDTKGEQIYVQGKPKFQIYSEIPFVKVFGDDIVFSGQTFVGKTKTLSLYENGTNVSQKFKGKNEKNFDPYTQYAKFGFGSEIIEGRYFATSLFRESPMNYIMVYNYVDYPDFYMTKVKDKFVTYLMPGQVEKEDIFDLNDPNHPIYSVINQKNLSENKVLKVFYQENTMSSAILWDRNILKFYSF